MVIKVSKGLNVFVFNWTQGWLDQSEGKGTAWIGSKDALGDMYDRVGVK